MEVCNTEHNCSKHMLLLPILQTSTFVFFLYGKAITSVPRTRDLHCKLCPYKASDMNNWGRQVQRDEEGCQPALGAELQDGVGLDCLETWNGSPKPLVDSFKSLPDVPSTVLPRLCFHSCGIVGSCYKSLCTLFVIGAISHSFLERFLCIK